MYLEASRQIHPVGKTRNQLEDIGQQAEVAETPAVRAWMRKLPGQLLRIAIALHIIECYHEPGRPRHEIQLDTLNRAVDFCRYYRSAFVVVQQSVSDSDSISSVLLKIWDKAATSKEGLAVRDAYRNIKALARRAKELGRNVGAYTIDLYYQLEKMGKGIVLRTGRNVRFVAGTQNSPTTPSGGGIDAVMNMATKNQGLEFGEEKRGEGFNNTDNSSAPKDNSMNPPLFSKHCLPRLETKQTRFDTQSTDKEGCPDFSSLASVTVVTGSEITVDQALEVSPINDLSPVTLQDLGRADTVTDDIDVQNLLTTPLSDVSNENSHTSSELDGDEPDDDPSGGGGVPMKPLPDGSDDGGVLFLLSDGELEGWLERMRKCANSDDCISFLQSVDQLSQPVQHQILSANSDCMSRFWEAAVIESLAKLPQNSGIGFGALEQQTTTTSTPSGQPLTPSSYAVPEVATEPAFNSNGASEAQAPTPAITLPKSTHPRVLLGGASPQQHAHVNPPTRDTYR